MKLKKILLVGGVVTLGVVLLGGMSAVKKGWDHAKLSFRGWVDENTSPETEIARLKGQVAELDGEENSIKNDLAKEIAACEKLEKNIKNLKAAVENERKDVFTLGEKIKDATAKVDAGGKPGMDIDLEKRKLVANRNAVVKREKALADLENTLQIREESKKVLFEQLGEISNLRTELNAELDALDAEYKALKLQGMKTKGHRDNSKLSEIREGIEKLKDKAAERRARIGLDAGKSKADAPVTESVDEILAPLSGK